MDGGSLWTCAQGKTDGRPVLLCNGGPGCCDYLAPVSAMLERDCFVIRFEQRGCGRSKGDMRYDLETTLGDMEAIRNHYGIERWIVGGHSWGANLALVYALEHTAHTIGVLYLAGSGIHGNAHWFKTFLRNREERGETLPDMAYPFNDEVNAQGNESLRAYGRRPDFYKRVSVLDVPTLFVLGERDIRPSWPIEQLAQLMPDARSVTLPNAELYLWLHEAERLEEALLAFLPQL